MSLYNYLLKADRFGQEIRFAFHPEEQQQLYSQLKAIGLTEYRVFVYAHTTEILQYLSLSPSQRNRPKWVKHPQTLLIRCAALQLSDVTAQFLSDISDIADVVDHGSYRDFHSIVAKNLLPMMLKIPMAYFPFPEMGNPFA